MVTKHLIAVVDGATAKSPRLFSGKRSGRFARDVLMAALEDVQSVQTPWQLVRELTQALNAAVEAEVGVSCAQLPLADRPTASAVLFLRERRMLAFVGDCQALVNRQHLICYENPTDMVVANVRRMRAYALMGQGVGDVSARLITRDSVDPLLAEGLLFRNRPGLPLSFAALDGTDIPNTLVQVHAVWAGSEVVLASDGYPKVLPTLDESEAELARLLALDPNGLEQLRGIGSLLPGQVSFDDRAYIRFKA